MKKVRDFSLELRMRHGLTVISLVTDSKNSLRVTQDGDTRANEESWTRGEGGGVVGEML